jgi:hypothetical protein
MDTLTETEARKNFACTAALDALDDAGCLPRSVELDIAEPCWLYAGQITERATGARLMFTYRSPELRDHDELGSPRYKRLADFTEGLLPGDVSRTLPDELMMFGEAELTIWEPR